MPLIQPESREFPTMTGGTKTFVLSKFPATVGREVVTQYPISAVPRLGDYKRNEELMLVLMRHVAVPNAGPDGTDLPLTTRALVDGHFPDFETLMRVEMAMLEYNCSFFARGKAQSFFEALVGKFQALISSTLTDFSRQFSKKD